MSAGYNTSQDREDEKHHPTLASSEHSPKLPSDGQNGGQNADSNTGFTRDIEYWRLSWIPVAAAGFAVAWGLGK
jgi:hypothetical protein